MEQLHVTRELDGRVVLLEFEHGKANEVGLAVLQELEQLVAELEQDPDVVALITTSRRVSGTGKPIFVAGANVTERSDWSDDRIRAHVRWQRSVLARLAAAPVFHVVVVNGLALGWGTEYLLTADYAIGCDGSVFALPETGLGILPGAGGTTELQARIGPSHALRLGMTGERIDADEASRIGLVQERATDVDAGLARARQLAAATATRSPTALAAFKAGVQQSRGRSAEERREIEARAYEHCVHTGEAAIGRKHFAASLKGEPMPWGPKQRRG